MIRFFSKTKENISFASCDEAGEIVAFLNNIINSSEYLEQNEDVVRAGINPINHWLDFGVYEGRALPGYDYSIINNKNEGRDGWKVFRLKEKFVEIKRASAPIDNIFYHKILEAAEIEPALLYPGLYALPYLRQFSATDLRDRDGLSVVLAADEVKTGADVIFIIPALVIGGAEKYTADLVSAFKASGATNIKIIVTDQHEADVINWQNISIFKPFLDCRVVFWREISPEGFRSPTTMAYFINALRPSKVVVVNSEVGLEVVAKYGKGISGFAKVICAFFSAGYFGLGMPYGVYYPRLTSRYSITITDNKKMADFLKSKSLMDFGVSKVVLIPPCISVLPAEHFQIKIDSKYGSASALRGQAKWLWISRIEKMKGTNVLSELAKKRPNDSFFIYGPLAESLEALGLDKKNINYCGILKDVISQDFSEFDGFIFTSISEGMPNIVLEMVQHGLPIITTDVGGLKDTFDAQSVFYIDNDEKVVSAFDAALDGILEKNISELKLMTVNAYESVLKRHSISAFQDCVLKNLG